MMNARFLVLFLIACGAAPKKATGPGGATGPTAGSGDTNQQPTGAKDFTVSAAAVTLAQGASKQINLTFTRTGGAFPISIAPGQADAGVSASAMTTMTNANSLPVTIAVAASVAPGPHKLVIDATGAEITKSVTISVTVTAKMLAGNVVDEMLRPVPGAEVYIANQEKIIADQNGGFAINNVSGNYDITIKKDTSVWVFKGLTRVDPTLQLIGYAPLQQYGANVKGVVGNEQPAVSGVGTTAIVLGTASCCGDYVLDATSNGGTFDEWLWWSTVGMANGTLHALRWSVDNNGLPITFLGYGTKTGIGMGDQAILVDQNVSLGSVGNSTIAGHVTAPTDYTLLARDVYVRLPGDNASLRVVHQFPAPEAFNYHVPQLAGASVGVLQYAQGSDGSTYAYASDLSVPQSSIALSLPKPPKTTVPSGSISASSTFSFSPMQGGGVHVSEFFEDGSSEGPHVYVISAQTSTTLPNISVVGLNYPKGKSYGFIVHGFQAQNVDAATTPTGFATPRSMFQTGRQPAGSGNFASSNAKYFNLP